ncbi:MAG: hypothetical protein GY737_00785 [Desulfobacteraceae bacterium]|nr:hypothetical protein [Desulfobacteraceae bacterium]
MLSLDTEWLVPVSLMRSDRWLAYYLSWNYCQEPEKLKEIALKSLADSQPFQHRKEDLRFAIEKWIDFNSQERLSLEYLDVILEIFLIWKGDCFEVKTERLEHWAALISKVDPVWIIARGYSNLLKENIITVEQLAELGERQCATAFSRYYKFKNFADNHVHLGGHGGHSLALFDLSLYLKHAVKPCDWPVLPEFSLFHSGEHNLNDLPHVINRLCGCLMKSIMTQKQEESLSWPEWNSLFLCRPANDGLPTTINLTPKETLSQRLLGFALKADTPVHHRWLMLATALIHEDRFQESMEFLYGIRAYIHSCNILRAGMIVSGVGLGHFVDTFRFKFRKGVSIAKLDYTDYALGSDNKNNVYREFKVSPGIIKKNPLRRLAINLSKHNREDHTHFTFHFTREPGRSPRTDHLQRYKRNILKKEVRRIQRFLTSTDLQHVELPKELENNTRYHANLINLVRGIDVAGNENGLPIEIFAPAIRTLRNSAFGSDSTLYKRTRRLHLSIHAGEDYSHLISGLRSIDETARFCDYRMGDRIGHALALGVDVNLWAKRQQRIYLPASEHLDNLVWCHHMATHVIQEVPRFCSTLSLLEQKIHRWSHYVYGETVSANTLFQAWELRRNCPLDWNIERMELNSWVPDYSMISNNPDSEPVRLWKRYLYSWQYKEREKNAHTSVSIKLSSTNMCGLNSKRNGDSDTISPIELELLSAIQDLLIQRYSQKQIILEACPSSNIYIGRFKEFKEHPLFRWYPPDEDWLRTGERYNRFGLRTGPIQFCINTDDSGLMPTTIENEHRLIKETAISSYQISSERAETWINCIRKIGVNAFRANHLKWLETESIYESVS